MFNIFIKELKELFANKKIWIGIITVLIIIIIGTSYNKKNNEMLSVDQLKLGVINHDESVYSDLLLNYFTNSKTFSSLISIEIGESNAIKNAFSHGELDIYLEIPKDFAINMIQIKHSPIKVYISIDDTTKAIIVQNMLKSYEKYIAAVEANAVGLYEIMTKDGMDTALINDTNRKISIDLILTALGKEALFSFHPVKQFPATKVFEYYLIALLIIVMMYLGLYVGLQLLREVRNGTMLRLMTTKTSVYQLVAAKILLMAALLICFSVITISLIMNRALLLEEILFCISISLFCVIFAVCLWSIFRTTKRYILAGNVLLFYFIVIGGGIIPLQFLPQNIIRLSKFTPIYYILEGVLRFNRNQTDDINNLTLRFFMISVVMYGLAILCIQSGRVIHEEE